MLGLDRITRLLGALGDPQRALPPVFHVAGTNGKGSTCAFLRSGLEAAGHRVHVYTSPHLVRFNERIRLAGALIEDAALAELLAEVFDACGAAFETGTGPSFFEVTTAAAFLAFARTPADACVIEVGLGGRLDATNVLEADAVAATGIAGLGLDHEAWLGDTIERIAFEKAGIARRGVPLVTHDYDEAVDDVIADAAEQAGAAYLPEGRLWRRSVGLGPGGEARLHLTDRVGAIMTPLPQLAGDHQVANLALALAMLRAQTRVPVSLAALKAAPEGATWPARLQRLGSGPLVDRLPAGAAVWLDGAHNPAAAEALAAWLAAAVPPERPLHLICGLLANKDAEGVVAALARPGAHFLAVPVRDHAHHSPELLAAMAERHGMRGRAVSTPEQALDAIAREGGKPAVLIVGSLYLAGEVLRANEELPT